MLLSFVWAVLFTFAFSSNLETPDSHPSDLQLPHAPGLTHRLQVSLVLSPMLWFTAQLYWVTLYCLSSVKWAWNNDICFPFPCFSSATSFSMNAPTSWHGGWHCLNSNMWPLYMSFHGSSSSSHTHMLTQRPHPLPPTNFSVTPHTSTNEKDLLWDKSEVNTQATITPPTSALHRIWCEGNHSSHKEKLPLWPEINLLDRRRITLYIFTSMNRHKVKAVTNSQKQITV